MQSRNWWIARWRIALTLRKCQETGDIRTRLLITESHHNDQTLAFFQTFQATGMLRMVQMRKARLRR